MWKEYPITRINEITKVLNTLDASGITPDNIKICVTDNMIGIFYYQI